MSEAELIKQIHTYISPHNLVFRNYSVTGAFLYEDYVYRLKHGGNTDDILIEFDREITYRIINSKITNYNYLSIEYSFKDFIANVLPFIKHYLEKLTIANNIKSSINSNLNLFKSKEYIRFNRIHAIKNIIV